MPIDINRNTSGLVLPEQVSTEIWSNAVTGSAVMSLAQKVNLPGSGSVIPVVTGDAEADWVAETDPKPVSKSAFSTKTMRAHKLAVIVPFSNEFTRDFEGLYQELVRRLPEALAKKFDATVFHGGETLADFDNLAAAPAVSLGTDVYAGLVEADTAVGVAGGVVNGYAVAPQGRGLLLGSVDGSGRPLFTSGPNSAALNTVLGSPVALSRAVYKDGDPDADVVGFAGDWTSARYGTVEGIKIDFSDQATLVNGDDTINLWQRNMTAVRAEVEVGFIVRDVNHFARLTA